jgi:hypothetical protein
MSNIAELSGKDYGLRIKFKTYDLLLRTYNCSSTSNISILISLIGTHK